MFSNKQPCPRCKNSIKEQFDFCPHCGCDVRDPEQDARDYGLLGKHDAPTSAPLLGGGGFGVSDKIIGALFNQVMKALEHQVKQTSEVHQLPNGIQIRVGAPQSRQRQPKQRKLSDEQTKRMQGAPRVEAKTDVRRLSDKVVYELKAPDITSLDDVFVAKVESGYEVKAIGKHKVYMNSLPVDLPLRSYGITENGIVLEFGTQ